MIRQVCSLAVCLSVLCSTVLVPSLHAEGYKSWCVYIALSPSFADILNQRDFGGSYDITKFKYPLYVGYIYSSDLVTNQVKCFEPIAQKAMDRWANDRKDGAEIWFDVSRPASGTSKFRFRPGDKDYEKAVDSDLYYRYYLYTVRSCINCEPDDLWRPVFKHQYTIDSPITNDKAFYMLREMMRDKDAWEILN